MTKANTQVQKQVNNLCAKIKTRYPNLYQETGGKLIRRTLIRMLQAESAPQADSPAEASEPMSSNSTFRRTRVITRKRARQQAA